MNTKLLKLFVITVFLSVMACSSSAIIYDSNARIDENTKDSNRNNKNLYAPLDSEVEVTRYKEKPDKEDLPPPVLDKISTMILSEGEQTAISKFKVVSQKEILKKSLLPNSKFNPRDISTATINDAHVTMKQELNVDLEKLQIGCGDAGKYDLEQRQCMCYRGALKDGNACKCPSNAELFALIWDLDNPFCACSYESENGVRRIDILRNISDSCKCKNLAHEINGKCECEQNAHMDYNDFTCQPNEIHDPVDRECENSRGSGNRWPSPYFGEHLNTLPCTTTSLGPTVQIDNHIIGTCKENSDAQQANTILFKYNILTNDLFASRTWLSDLPSYTQNGMVRDLIAIDNDTILVIWSRGREDWFFKYNITSHVTTFIPLPNEIRYNPPRMSSTNAPVSVITDIHPLQLALTPTRNKFYVSTWSYNDEYNYFNPSSILKYSIRSDNTIQYQGSIPSYLAEKPEMGAVDWSVRKAFCIWRLYSKLWFQTK